MIKKITIILLCALVLAVCATVILGRLGISPANFGPAGGNIHQSANHKDGWGYDRNDTGITLTSYSGRDTSVTIPEVLDGLKVTTLGKDLFAGNTRIREVTIPASVTRMEESVFENCTSLSMVSLPADLKAIPAKAFSGCISLSVLQLPADIRSIGRNAFSGCTGLTYLAIPDSVTSVGAEAFLNCENLSELEISRNLSTIGTHAFRGTKWYNAQTDTFVIIGNQVLIKYNGIDEVVQVPLGVTSITDAFEDNLFPLEIILPDSLTTIGPHAFSGCRSLETINLPINVRSIGEAAFRGCSHLSSISFPDSMVSLGSSAFQSCSALERIIIPYGVSTIPALCFANCEKLRSIQIPETVMTIADNAMLYSGVSELRVVRGSAGETFAKDNGYHYIYQQQTTGDFIFQQTEDGVQIVLYVGSIYDVVIPERVNGEKVTSLSDILFQHNSYVRSVTLPKTITRIADFSFANMSDLRSVVLPDTLTSIGMAAFQNDAKLGELEIPESVTEIAEDAFVGCPSLVIVAEEGTYAFEWALNAGVRVKDKSNADTSSFSFVQPAGITLIYSYDGSETAPELPRINEYGDSILGIAEEAFRGKDLTSVSIPDGYESIGDYAFAEISNDFEITLPKSVVSIGEHCFSGTNVVIHGYNGSYAETFAREHAIKFLVIADWEI